MLHKLRARAQDEKGFTLIELLVVILIIGILAAIALPAFLIQRDKAQDTEAKTTVRTAQTAMETQYTDANDYTGDAGRPRSHRARPERRPGVHRRVALARRGPPRSPSATGNTFTIAKDTAGNVTRKCAGTAKGGCPSAGWTKAP